MNQVQFPPEFTPLFKGAKAAFVSEVQPRKPSDCQNCGGAGFMAVFIASIGPLNSPPNNCKDKVHFDGNRCWIGETFTASCPACLGTGKAHEMPKQMVYNTERRDWVTEA